MPMDNRYKVTLTWETKPSENELTSLIRSLAQWMIEREGLCRCFAGNCMKPSELMRHVFDTLPCREAGNAWLLTSMLLGGCEALADYSAKIYSLDHWIKQNPQLEFSLEYRSVDYNGTCGSRVWYAGGRLIAEQEGSPQIVWGERKEILDEPSVVQEQ